MFTFLLPRPSLDTLHTLLHNLRKWFVEMFKVSPESDSCWFDWHRCQMGGSIGLQTALVPPRSVDLCRGLEAIKWRNLLKPGRILQLEFPVWTPTQKLPPVHWVNPCWTREISPSASSHFQTETLHLLGRGETEQPWPGTGPTSGRCSMNKLWWVPLVVTVNFVHCTVTPLALRHTPNSTGKCVSLTLADLQAKRSSSNYMTGSCVRSRGKMLYMKWNKSSWCDICMPNKVPFPRDSVHLCWSVCARWWWMVYFNFTDFKRSSCTLTWRRPICIS